MKSAESKTIKFECAASLLEDKTVEDLKVSEASLVALKNLIDPNTVKNNSYIQHYAGDLFNSDVANRNGSAVSLEDTVKCYKSFEGRFIDLEHSRNQIVGYIVKASLTNPETKQVLTDEEALSTKAPVNCSIVFAVWPPADPALANLLDVVGKSDEPSVSGLISLSLELAYSEYNLLIGSNMIANGTVISSESEITKLESCLSENGGSGYLPDGKTPVYKLLAGELMPIGAGLVTNPAAYVKGIVSIESPENTNDPSYPSETNSVVNSQRWISVDNNPMRANSTLTSSVQKFVESVEKFININEIEENDKKISVESSQDKNKNVKASSMKKILSVSDITDEAIEAKEVTASEISRIIADELAVKCEEHKKEVDAKEAELNKAKEDADYALKTLDELNIKFEAISKELEDMKAAQTAEKAQADFNARMSSLSDEFELDEEDCSVIASQIKDLDEVGFESWKKSFDVIAKQKNKKFVKKNAPVDPQEPDADDQAKASVSEVVASTEVVVEADPLDLVQAEVKVVPGSVTLSEDKISAYRDAFTIGKGVTLK